MLGGSPRISATIAALKEDAEMSGNEVLVLHAGDAITGTLTYTLFGPEVDAAVMNEIGFDAFVLGNHEFDDGDSNVAAFAELLEVPITSFNCM